MKCFTLLLGCLFLSCTLSAQYVWDGGGDGTSWDDAANWARDEVPATDSLVSFQVDATVTGNAANNPVGIRIGKKANVVLNLDLTVGNGITAEHAITFGDSCSLTIGAAGSTPTIAANPTSGKHGVAIFGGSEMVAVTVSEGATFELVSGVSGINLANGNSTVTNNGSILLREGLKDGIRVVGTFTNNGTISGGTLDRDLFNVKDGGILINTAAGTIVSDQPGDDGIDLLTGASFVNDGTLMLTAKDNASSGNNTIAVGNATSAATFTNNSQMVLLNGGGGDGALSGRTLTVDTLGVLINTGTITISGGDDKSRLHVKGVAENALNGIIDLTDGRFNANGAGTITNNGLLKSTRDGSGGFVTGTAINNGFFDYSTSNLFASGSMGTIVDKGFSLNNNDVRVNARRECTVDLANAPYEWFLDGESYATASDTGALAFSVNSIIADSVVLTTTLPGVEVKVINICDTAVMTSGIFSPVVMAESVLAYPNPVARGGEMTLDLSAMPRELVTFQITSAFGQRVGDLEVRGGEKISWAVGNLKPGTYFLSAVVQQRRLLARVVITH